jgi:hypothetical protein
MCPVFLEESSHLAVGLDRLGPPLFASAPAIDNLRLSLEEERESSQAARRADHITDLSPYLMLWFFKKVRPLILWQTCFAFLGYHRKQDSSAFKLALHGESRLVAVGGAAKALVCSWAGREVHGGIEE